MSDEMSLRDAPLTDLIRLDADVRVVAERLAKERDELRRGSEDALAAARRRDPFEDARHVAGQTLFRTLSEREPAAHELLHRDGLLRWMHELLQARIARDLVVEEAKRLHAPAVDPSRPARRRALSLDPSTSTPSSPDSLAGARDDADDTFVRAFSELVSASDVVRAEGALARAVSLAPPIAAVRRELRARRFEAARRLGLAHPSALSVPESARAADPSGARLARAVLDATEPLATALHAPARKRAGGTLGVAVTLQSCLARDVREGWPAKLGQRWIEGVFGPLVLRPLRGIRFPEPLGGASFLRAAYQFGAALREQGTARSLPFALARDPYAGGVHRFGATLALGLADPVLQTKRLGVSRGVAADQARTLRRSAFVALRTMALRVALAQAEQVDPSAFEELCVRVLGGPLPEALRDAWPDARVDDVARLAAATSAPGLLAGLVERFDEDWFANPRAGTHLASVACGPVAEPDWPTEAEIARLARACEEALG